GPAADLAVLKIATASTATQLRQLAKLRYPNLSPSPWAQIGLAGPPPAVTLFLMVISDLVLREGDGLRASGRVVTDRETVWFEPPLPVPLVWRSSGNEPAPGPSEFGVPVLG